MTMENYTFHVVTEDDLAEVHRFALENIQPEWQFCGGMPPVPNIELMQLNLELGNPFVVVRRNGELMGYQIANRKDGRLLWGLAHKDLKGEELLEAHAHLTALLWRELGYATHEPVPEASDENIADELNSALGRAYEIYEAGEV